MVVVEVAGDVIGSDCPEPDLSLGFTDRVLSAMKPAQEPRVVRIVRLRRAAAFLGPVLSAAAVWMIVVSAVRPVPSVSTPVSLRHADVLVTPRTEAAIEVAAAPTGSTAIVNELAGGLLSTALTAWRDTQRSTRDLVMVGQYVFSTAGEPLNALPEEEVGPAQSGVLRQAESVLMNLLVPKAKGETVPEGPDVL